MKNGQNNFSALEYSKELRGVGFTQEQAELQARQLELVKGEIQSELATRRDIEGLREATKRDNEGLREATKRDNEELRETTRRDIKELDLKIANIEKEIAELKRDTKDQTLKIIGVLGSLIVILKFLPDFFN